MQTGHETVSLRAQLVSYLVTTWAWAGIDGLADEIEVALYYFACHYHGGQSSELYAVLSTCDFIPGRFSSLETEGETVRSLYESLVDKFADSK